MLALLLELLVIGLLATTVVYCIMLDRRLQKLRQDESSMRKTIVDLGLATERAERAIDGLRQSLNETDGGLVSRLKAAEEASRSLVQQTQAAEGTLERIARIVAVGRRAQEEAEGSATASEAQSTGIAAMAARAEAFAARARSRVGDRAA
jgi:Domain of unknown function (DUF6468)